jgi:hypothetical protein
MPGALHGPLIVLLEEDGADAVGEWRFRWDGCGRLSAPLDLAPSGGLRDEVAIAVPVIDSARAAFPRRGAGQAFGFQLHQALLDKP